MLIKKSVLPLLGSCAFIRNNQGQYLFQKRDVDARYAPGKIACFGGAREGTESPMQTLRRELQEELELEFDDKQVIEMGYIEHVPVVGKASLVFIIVDVDDRNLVLHEGEAIVRVRSLSEIDYNDCAEFLHKLYRYADQLDSQKDKHSAILY